MVITVARTVAMIVFITGNNNNNNNFGDEDG